MTLSIDLFRSSSDIALVRREAELFEASLDLATHADWDALSDRRHADGTSDEELSQYALNRLADFLDPIGDSAEDVLGAIAMPSVLASATSLRIRELRESTRKTQRPTDRTAGWQTVEHLREKVLPLELRNLPQTVLDPAAEFLDSYGDVDPAIVTRLGTFSESRLQTFAAICVIVAKSFNPAHRAGPQLCHHERREDLFRETGEDPFDAEAVGRVYDAYFVDKTLFPGDSDYLRGNVCRGLFFERRLLLDYAASKKGLLDTIAKTLPALPAEGSRYFLSVVRASSELRLASIENRKRHADILSDNFDDILFACRAREAQTRRMKLNCDEVRKQMLARQNDGHYMMGNIQSFSYHERVVSPRGRRLDCFQKIHMSARRASSILAGGSPDDIQFSFDRVEAVGSRRHNPWFVELYATGLLLHGPTVPRNRREARRALFIKLKMPDRGDKAAGLLVDEGSAGGVILAAGLAMGHTLIPVDALAHAMLMTYAMVRIMALTMCRVGEALQITYEPAHWKVENVDDRVVQMFLAIPKGWEDYDSFVIDDRTVRLLARLSMTTMSPGSSSGTSTLPT